MSVCHCVIWELTGGDPRLHQQAYSGHPSIVYQENPEGSSSKAYIKSEQEDPQSGESLPFSCLR